MESNAFASIITVCRNSATTIKDTIESVLTQSCSDYEYIIVDGNSTDGTLDIIKSYEARFGTKLRVISENDNGIYDAMNKGVRMATGQLICFLNSDDWFEPDAIKNIKEAYSGNKYEVVYGMQRTITDGKEENCVIYNHNFLTKNMLCHQATFVTKACFDDFGLFSTEFQSVSDYEFILRLYFSKKVFFNPIYKVIVNFRSGGMCYSYVAIKELAILKMHYGLISKKRMYILFLKEFLVKMKMFSVE